MKSYQSEANKPEPLSANGKETQFFKKDISPVYQNPPKEVNSTSAPPVSKQSIFRLSVKHYEYVYARPDDIVMIESCDHLVKVYVGAEGKSRLATRHNTLKEFLLQLPSSQFLRISRFCAINLHRLTGGNCHEQVLEFDFKISLKLKHPVSHTVFSSLGI